MRPDQHKKKRSTQYKKKHGISDKPKTDDNNQGKGTSGQGSTKWQEPKKLDGAKNVDKSKLDEESNGSSAEEEHVQTTSFRRRKILSNWDRYQSLPPETEDENLSEIGDDFAKLLSQTADALSQFRFKDEKEWEEEKTLLSSNFVALDCEALANSLQCLPLHERLGLDAALFGEEQLKSFAAEAEKNRLLYNPDSCSTIVQEQQPALDVKAMHSVLSAAMHLVPAILKKANIEPKPSENDAETVQIEEKEQTELTDNDDSPLPNTNKESVSNSTDTTKSAPDVPTKSAPAVPTKSAPVVPCNPVSEEDELDMLLSFGNSKPQTDVGELGNANRSTEISAPVEKKYVSSATASLEDWLDSVLDS